MSYLTNEPDVDLRTVSFHDRRTHSQIWCFYFNTEDTDTQERIPILLIITVIGVTVRTAVIHLLYGGVRT